jgi:glutamyl-tRNA synthetase
VHKSGAKFDPEKAKWFNQQYLRKQSDEQLAEAFKPVLIEKGIAKDDAFIVEFCKLMKEKVQFTHEFWEQGSYVFEAPTNYDEKVVAKKWNDTSKDLYTKLHTKLQTVSVWNATTLHDEFAIAQTEIGKLDMQLLRVLITGVAGGPQLFDMLALIGKDETLNRLKIALNKL